MESNHTTLLAIDFPPQSGGIARYLDSVVRHMQPTPPEVIAAPFPGAEQSDAAAGCSVRRIAVPLAQRYPRLALKFLGPAYAAALWRHMPVRIICGQAHYSLLLPAMLARWLRGVPYAVMVYGLDVLSAQRKVYRPLFNWLLRSAAAVIACSQAAADLAVRIGVPAERVHVAYPEIGAERFTQGISLDVRQMLGLGAAKIILSVGRLIPRKGFDSVIRALPEIRHAIPNAHYLVVGAGPDATRLRALASAMGVEEHVTFVGFVNDRELPSYYAAGDLFVMVSREIPEKGDIEGFGIVYLEAGLMGKPSVAGVSGGAGEAVVDGVTGVLVDPRDEHALAQAIVRVLGDSALSERLGAAARARVLASFSEGSAARAVMRALEGIG